LSLDFLSPGKKYEATIYKDDKDSNYDDDVTSMHYSIVKQKVTSKSKLKLTAAPGGGYAISIKAL